MDPNANLAEQEELLQEISEYGRDTHHPACINAQRDLIDVRQALYDWLRDGGYEPDWNRAPNARKHYGR